MYKLMSNQIVPKAWFQSHGYHDKNQYEQVPYPHLAKDSVL